MNLNLRGLLLPLMLIACSIVVAQEEDGNLPPGATRLSTEEIQRLFSGVRDDAEVQDLIRTRAVNEWLSDGSFVNRWSNAERSGEVRGRWWAEDDRRCIVITGGLPDREGIESCGPLYREQDLFYSVNQDGSVHGIHRLSPLRAK
ncbi:hypothetical protein EYC87_16130 [Halieaceae bacterium IMCC8485]|jgi:hypothetical protein|uniref:Uncharacterized protein n=1 Tax=Candidatus Seongchinamella marina TaxID=2518990 RepID=A0ABT3SYP6_9GAMM|nr:hypothetical protein [Candidatus Seongchinamella marina]MCX2975114.1 hypothetical protein [Candidatus Seongchinamella marina]